MSANDNDELYAHRKKHIKGAVRDKRYIRGVINKQIEDAIHSRRTGDQTTDPRIRAAVLKKTGGRCYLCHREYDPTGLKAEFAPDLYFDTLQIDHIVAFSKFGPNHIGNYMPACSRCNNLKSDLSMGEAKERIRRSIARKRKDR